MHYHVELWVPGKPSQEDARGAAEELVNALCAEDEEGEGARFDWGVVGGRWTGEHDDYDPTKDPANQITCRICNGKKVRFDLGISARMTGEANGKVSGVYKGIRCNGCNGTGKETKWELNPHDGDAMPQEFLRKLKPKLTACGVGWMELGEAH